MKERGVQVDHSTINRWVIKYAKELEATLSKAFRKYGSYVSWKIDETCLKHKGKDVYLYRAIDKHGLPEKVNIDKIKKGFTMTGLKYPNPTKTISGECKIIN